MVQLSDIDRLAALSVAISDALLSADADLSPSAQAALSVLTARDKLSIGELARVVGLTHSATVRLVDRLAEDWLVRRTGRKGREVFVELTARGRHRAGDLSKTRRSSIEQLLAQLDPEARDRLDEILSRLISAVAPDPETAARVFRYTGARG